MANKIAALYSRVSTEQQVERGESIPFQKRCLEKKAIELGYSFVHYSDEGVSGGSTKRADFLRMLSDVESDKYNAAFFYDLSRVSRDMLDSLLLRKTLDEHKVEIFSVSEDIDFKTDEGDFMYKIKGLVNERYRKDLIKRVKATMWAKAERGDFCGGQTPYGYDAKDKKLIINEAEAEIVRKIYNRFEDDPFFRGVTVWLNDAGYRTKKGTTFAQSTVKRLLTNPVYKACQTYGKRPGSKKYAPKEKWITVKCSFDPIISEEQFDRVQSLIKEKKREKRQMKYGTVFLLSTLLRCECGGSLNGYTMLKKSSGKLYRYYKCHNNTSKGGRICPGNSLRKDVIEALVMNKIRERVGLHFEEAETQHVVESREKNSPSKILERIDVTLVKLRAKQRRQLELYEEAAVPKDILLKRMKDISDEIEKEELCRSSLERELDPSRKSTRLNLIERINQLNGNFISLPDVTKKDILRQLVKAIIVKRNGEVDIELFEI